MEYSAIGMALVGTEGQWLQSNKALCQFLGYSQEELRGLTFQQLTWPEDLNKDLQQVEKLISGEINTYSMEKRYYNRNGDVVWRCLPSHWCATRMARRSILSLRLKTLTS